MTQNHYEVLGIRRNASAAEIELAYKGRRTQYHPDKYQGSDAETLRWATARMQEVNEAHAVVSDAQQRARFDAGDRHADSAAHSTGVDRIPVSLRELLQQRLAPFEGFSRIYFAPQIPLQKLSAALGSYGQGVDARDVLVLIDSTVFGGAKDGLMLTERRIYMKDLMIDSVSRDWRGVQTIASSGTGVYINGHQMVDCKMADAPDLERLFAVAQEFVASKAAASPAQPPEAAARTRQKTSPIQPEEKHLKMFEAAKMELRNMCEAIDRLECELEEELIDRDSAVEYFGHLDECLRDADSADGAWRELGEIMVLSKCVMAVGSKGRPPEILFADREGDSQLVDELRALVRVVYGMRDEVFKREADRAVLWPMIGSRADDAVSIGDVFGHTPLGISPAASAKSVKWTSFLQSSPMTSCLCSRTIGVDGLCEVTEARAERRTHWRPRFVADGAIRSHLSQPSTPDHLKKGRDLGGDSGEDRDVNARGSPTNRAK